MMFKNYWRTGTATFAALGIIAGAATPIIAPAPAFAQTSFSDVSSGYWAQGFIQALAARNIIAGFPDGTFKPDAPVTRAQFAAIVNKAFQQSQIRSAINFNDVASSYWAYSAINNAYQMAFMSGYPNNLFQPDQNITRAQALVALASGLNYTTSTPTSSLLQTYTDAANIPSYATDKIAAATQKQIVVNYPSVNNLNPTQNATRADVAAFVYQALVNNGTVQAISSPYIVVAQGTQSLPQPQQNIIPAGTTIPVSYSKSQILVAPNEPNPVPVTLTVAQNLVSSQGTVLVPSGSQVVGEIRTTSNGAQFFAKQLVLANGQQLAINATSGVVTTTQQVNKGLDVLALVRNAAIGAGAAAVIAGVTGNKSIATEKVLLGAGVTTVLSLLGVLPAQDKATLISINPNNDLTLKLNSDLVLN